MCSLEWRVSGIDAREQREPRWGWGFLQEGHLSRGARLRDLPAAGTRAVLAGRAAREEVQCRGQKGISDGEESGAGE